VNTITRELPHIKFVYELNMYPRQPQELFKFKSHRSKVKVIFQAKVYQIYSVEREKIVVNNVVSCLSVARSISEIFAIEIKNWPK